MSEDIEVKKYDVIIYYREQAKIFSQKIHAMSESQAFAIAKRIFLEKRSDFPEICDYHVKEIQS